MHRSTRLAKSQTDRNDRCTERPTDSAGRQTCWQAGRQARRPACRQAGGQEGSEGSRERSRQTDMQVDGWTDR